HDWAGSHDHGFSCRSFPSVGTGLDRHRNTGSRRGSSTKKRPVLWTTDPVSRISSQSTSGPNARKGGGDQSMSAPQERWRHPGPGPLAGWQVTPRGGVFSLIATLTREGMTVLPAILVIAGIIALARPSKSQPARRVALNEAGGRVRSLAFKDGGLVLAATTL